MPLAPTDPWIVDADLIRFGGPTAVVNSFSLAMREAECASITHLAKGYIKTIKGHEIVAIGDDVKAQLARMAFYQLMGTRGYAPGAGADETYRLRFEDGMRWLRDIAAGSVHPNVTVEASEDGFEDQPRVISNPRRT